MLEAMALGLVPVIVDYGGPAELISPESGIAVPIGARDQVIGGFRAALTRLSESPGAIRPMGERARQHVLRHFTWDAKARQVMEVYRWVLRQRTTMPSEAELFSSKEAVGSAPSESVSRSSS